MDSVIERRHCARVVLLLIVHVILCIRSKRAQKYKVGNIAYQQHTIVCLRYEVNF